MGITPDDVARSNTLDEINTLYSKATRDYENARQARRKFGSRNTLHALMSATKSLDLVKKNEMI